MKILTYGNRKEDPSFIDVSTPEKEQAAFLLMFKHLRDSWDVYGTCPPTGRQKALYDKANEGDADAAKKLLILRKTWEYEEWDYDEVLDPLSVTEL